jgi:hypothetical protein
MTWTRWKHTCGYDLITVGLYPIDAFNPCPKCKKPITAKEPYEFHEIVVGKSVKTMCPQCDGAKFIEELSYPDRKKVTVKCQSCKGKGYGEDDLPD